MLDESTHSTIQQHIIVDIKKWICLKWKFSEISPKVLKRPLEKLVIGSGNGLASGRHAICTSVVKYTKCHYMMRVIGDSAATKWHQKPRTEDNSFL